MCRQLHFRQFEKDDILCVTNVTTIHLAIKMKLPFLSIMVNLINHVTTLINHITTPARYLKLLRKLKQNPISIYCFRTTVNYTSQEAQINCAFNEEYQSYLYNLMHARLRDKLSLIA